MVINNMAMTAPGNLYRNTNLFVPLALLTFAQQRRLCAQLEDDGTLLESRGGVVDEDALYDALKNGTLGGAALDVFEKEPAIGNKLAELDNVILTPHIGAQTKEAQSLAANVIAEKIIQILRGVI